MSKEKDDAIVALINIYIQKTQPLLPRVSDTYAARIGSDAADAEILSASLLCHCLRAFYLEIVEAESLSFHAALVLRAFLAQTLSSGNCSEFALIAGLKLAECPVIKRVMRLGDTSKNDHAYLKLIDCLDRTWIYDPWLNSEALFTPDEHVLTLRSLGLLSATPDISHSDTIFPLPKIRGCTEDFEDSRGAEDYSDDDYAEARGLVKKYQRRLSVLRDKVLGSAEYAFVMRAGKSYQLDEAACEAAKELTTEALGRIGL